MTGRLAPGPRPLPSSTGSTLVRLLAQLDDAPAAAPPGAFADGLTDWFGWTDAIALSAVLETAPAASPASPAASPGARPLADPRRELHRVRSALAKEIAQACADDDASGAAEEQRRRYTACQQAMAMDLRPLRRRLRLALATRGPGPARLAALDERMEDVVGAREQALLATLPQRIGRHFERLRGAGAGQTWLATFRRDMQALLLAELELRLLPLEALIEALGPAGPAVS